MNQRLLLHLIVVTSTRLDPVHRKQTLVFSCQQCEIPMCHTNLKCSLRVILVIYTYCIRQTTLNCKVCNFPNCFISWIYHTSNQVGYLNVSFWIHVLNNSFVLGLASKFISQMKRVPLKLLKIINVIMQAVFFEVRG